MALKYLYSGAGGAANGNDWANAYLTMVLAFAGMSAGDQLNVAHDHAENTAANTNLNSPGTVANPCIIRCVNRAGSVPPVSADLTSGATVTATGTGNAITFGGYADCDGIEFKGGTAGNNFNIIVGGASTTTGWTFGPLSKKTIVSTGTSSAIGLGTATTAMVTRGEYNGVVFKFAAVAQGFTARSGTIIMRNCSIDAAGSIPTNLFSTGSFAVNVLAEGCDFSALGSGKTIVGAGFNGIVTLKDCLLDAAATIAATPTAVGLTVFVSRCSTTELAHVERLYRATGIEVSQLAVVRTGGTVAAHEINSTANAKFILPFDGIPMSIWNGTVDGNVTVTLEGIANMAALPKNDEVWFLVEYLGTSGNSRGVFKSGTKADVLATGSDLTASTAAWDSGVTARANTTTYNVGDIIKVASNPNRIFFCTTGGQSAGSEPVGYASAVDGGSVTDNAATFRAGMRFKQAITLTSPQPQVAGMIYVYPKVGIASTRLFLDRAITLS